MSKTQQHNPRFSSGPCTKFKGWDINNIDFETLGRSHRSEKALGRLRYLCSLVHELMELPEDYKVAITPASDTGAFELAMWNLLGSNPNGIDVFAWEHFSRLWLFDIIDELKIENAVSHSIEPGDIPELSFIDGKKDCVFAWNGTTSGVMIPPDFSFPERENDDVLRFCDATSAVFVNDLPVEDLDIITWSLQKSIGGEAQQGIIVMSPRAIQRLENYIPTWPIPKVFKLRNKAGVKHRFFDGITLNTPSMLAIEDGILALEWAKNNGGRAFLREKCLSNYAVIRDWVKDNGWIEFLPIHLSNKQLEVERYLSITSPCFVFVDEHFLTMDPPKQAQFVQDLRQKCEDQDIAYDINSYSTSPLGLRIWCGPTVEADDLKSALKGITDCFYETLTEYQAL